VSIAIGHALSQSRSQQNSPAEVRLSLISNFRYNLKFFVKIAHRAGDIHSAGDAALAVFDPLYDTGGFVALGTVG
jgi:hypothetical protein